jgi:hypothetical protein
MAKFLEYELFERMYQATGKYPSGHSLKAPKKALNPKQLKSAYKSYARRVERLEKKDKADPDAEFREAIRARDGGRCRLRAVLTQAEEDILRQNAGALISNLDVAHCYGKSAHPGLRHEMLNAVLLNRASHGWLDTGKSPLDGSPITVIEKLIWWKRILGKSNFEALVIKARQEE